MVTQRHHKTKCYDYLEISAETQASQNSMSNQAGYLQNLTNYINLISTSQITAFVANCRFLPHNCDIKTICLTDFMLLLSWL